MIRLRPVDVARDYHRTSDWLRSLERAGIIPPAKRDFRGFRYYEPSDVEEIRRIVLGKGGAEVSVA